MGIRGGRLVEINWINGVGVCVLRWEADVSGALCAERFGR